MKKAATFTGLEIQYSPQPIWSDSDVDDLRENNGAGSLNSGSALSWLGHLHMLQQARQYTTTLIVEDDVDWDIEVRTQVAQVAQAVRNLTQPGEGKDAAHPNRSQPYGTNWDVLWLGHCGSSITDDYITFHDPTIPPVADSSNPAIQHNDAKLRYVHPTADPRCVYAYAVTQESATKILKKRTHGNAEGIDMWFRNMCRDGKLRCMAVSPELFHKHEAGGVHDNGPGADAVVRFARTPNIWHSARCNSDATTRERIACPHQYGEAVVGEDAT